MIPIVPSHGANIPALGFGTYRMSGAEIHEVLPQAIRAGFRHIDTAQIYENEDAVGSVIASSGIPRDQFFLTTKIWVTNFAEGDFERSLDESLARLQTDYVDLLLLHWPGGSEVPMADRIGRLNEVHTAGKTRHIGVSNYNAAQMREAVQHSDAPLVTNQVEYHPWLAQGPVLLAARELGLSITSYYAMADGRAATDPLLAEIGADHGKTAAQVALRWLVQQPGVIALSKTARVERLAENLAIFDFTLNKEEMAAIHALARPDGRIVNPGHLAPHWD